WEQAARQGHAGARYNLGLLYAEGLGVARDDRKALILWSQAAEQGEIRAKYNLGVLYERGRGISGPATTWGCCTPKGGAAAGMMRRLWRVSVWRPGRGMPWPCTIWD
ncbi:MAG: sel1 repeat family protein, partial [Magnetococcales bacterium]|nr:sel1 repeat family protein [Magnetococcales bacterium]